MKRERRGTRRLDHLAGSKVSAWSKRAALLVAAVLVGTAAFQAVGPVAAMAAGTHGAISTGWPASVNQTFQPGDSYCSNGACLAQQYDGNVVLYKCIYQDGVTCSYNFTPGAGWPVLWATNKFQSGSYPNYSTTFQSEGNLVQYFPPPARFALWASNTRPIGAYLELQADGNLVIYDKDWVARWATNTAWRPNT